MKQTAKEAMQRIKDEILEATKEMDSSEREEFYCIINEWTYDKYEEALVEGELEMQDYERD